MGGPRGPNDERIMAFLDLSNLTSSAVENRLRDHGFLPDYTRMVRHLVGDRRLVRTYAYDTLYEREGGVLKRLGLATALRKHGVRVRTITQTEEDYVGQKEVDVMLATELLAQAYHNGYDTAIVVSGDRDFVPAIQHVQGMGRRVEVAAYAGLFPPRLRDVVDDFHVLDEIPFIRPPRQETGEEAPHGDP